VAWPKAFSPRSANILRFLAGLAQKAIPQSPTLGASGTAAACRDFRDSIVGVPAGHEQE
jgi:hypothetical protein